MGQVLSTIPRVLFGVNTAAGLIAAAVLIKVLKLVPRFLITTRYKQGLSLVILKFAWKVSLLLTPWVRIMPAADVRTQWRTLYKDLKLADEEAKTTGEDFHPTFVLGNHTSFLDTMLTVSEMPSSVLNRGNI